MRKARNVLGLALLLGAFLYLLPVLQAADNPVPDSPEVAELLTQAKSHALQLRDDAQLMHQFSLMKVSWESHAEQIMTIKGHANNLGKVLKQMADRQESASPWQQSAIERITPLAQEMATNIETTIEHLNNNQSRLHMPQYKEYLSANSEVASSLSELISDYVAYGNNKAKYDRLGSKLEMTR